MLQRTGQRRFNFQDRAGNVPPLNNGVSPFQKFRVIMMQVDQNFIKVLIDNPKKVLVLLVTILTPLIIAVLFALWIAKKLEISPIQPQTINIQEKAIKDGSTYLLELSPVNILDLDIKADIVTLDNLVFSDAEKSRLISLTTRFPNLKEQIQSLSRGFHTDRIWNLKSYPLTSHSFKRFNEAMADPLLKESLFTNERKEIFLSEKFWEFHEKGVKIAVFPPGLQYSVSVLTINGVTESAKLYMSGRDDALNQALRRASGQQTIHIESSEGIIYACIHSGETLKFESQKYFWSITVRTILNPGSWRGNEDLVLVDWKAVELAPNK